MAKKKTMHEIIVADDGGGALILPENADPKCRKEAKELFKTIKERFAHLVALETGKTRVELYNPKTEDKRGWLFMDRGGHTYNAARADDSREYVATCSGFPTLKWIARTKKDALAGIKNVVKAAERAIQTCEIVRMSEISRVESETAKQKESKGRHNTITVQDYDGARKAYFSSPKLSLKGKKKKYPSRDEIHDRGRRKKGFDFWNTIDKLAAPKPTSPKDLDKWVEERKNIERLARALRLYGISVFGDAGRFDVWLQTEIPALGYVRPCSLLGTADGIQELINELGRIEHGIIS